MRQEEEEGGRRSKRKEGGRATRSHTARKGTVPCRKEKTQLGQFHVANRKHNFVEEGKTQS